MVLTTKTLGGPWPENYWWCNWHQKILKLETKQTRIQSCTDWSLKRPWSSNKAAVTKLLPSAIVTGHQLPWPPCHIQCFQGFIHADQCLTEVPSKVHILKPFGSTLRLKFQLPRDYSYPLYDVLYGCVTNLVTGELCLNSPHLLCSTRSLGQVGPWSSWFPSEIKSEECAEYFDIGPKMDFNTSM